MQPAKPTAVRCADGKMHQLIYLGSSTQAYRCTLCGATVPKQALKDQTEPRLVPAAPVEREI